MSLALRYPCLSLSPYYIPGGEGALVPSAAPNYPITQRWYVSNYDFSLRNNYSILVVYLAYARFSGEYQIIN